MGLYKTGTIAISTAGAATGTGTAWTTAGTGIRTGQTILVNTNPAQQFTIQTINSATSLTLSPVPAAAIPAGTTYAILTTDALSVDGLGSQVAEAITYFKTSLGGRAASGANSDITSLGGLTTPLSLAQGGNGATTAAGARSALGAFSSAGGAVSGTLTAGAAAGIGVAAGENNRVEINNVTSGGGAGNPIGWTVYRWYNELAQTGIRRAGDTTIQSYFVALSGGGGWEFLRGGNATASGTWTSGSDVRHKFDIEKVKNALAAVLTFNGSVYGKKDGGREVGLIAQDVERACKEAITYNGDRKFSDGTVIPNFKYLNTAGAAAAYHTEAIKTLFELVELALDKPDDARALIASIKEQSEAIKNIPIENEDPWKEAPPIYDVPSSEDYEEPST